MQKYLSSERLSAESFSRILRGETWSLLYSHTTGKTHFTRLTLGEVLPFACSTRTVSEDIQPLEHPPPPFISLSKICTRTVNKYTVRAIIKR
jgi:hypothetical protein